MNDSVIAGALFDFMGWLTSRPKRIMLSSVDDASPAVDAIRDFAKMRGLSLDDAKVQEWTTAIPPQPQRKPEQEPVAWGIIASNTGRICQVELDADEVEGHNPKHIVPLYTFPPAQRKPLDAGEISRLWKQHTSEDGPHHNPYDDDGLGFARAIEAAHGIKGEA